MTKSTTRLIQLQKNAHRRVALVDEPDLRLLTGLDSIYELSLEAIRVGTALSELARRSVSNDRLSYDQIYSGRSDWRILPPGGFSGRAFTLSGFRHRTDAPGQRAKPTRHAREGRRAH